MDMTKTSTDTAADRDAGPGSTDLERQVAASEHASGGDTGACDTRVVLRHGIWTVSAAGAFLGDYLDEGAALAAAAQARGRGEDGVAADPWPRTEKEARP
jgi:hypothetical protein